VNLLREAGATEVHVRVSSPPVKYSCYFGIDTPERENLIASTHSLDEIRDLICADSVGYISRDGLLSTFKGAGCEFCTGCFTGDYPVEIVDEEAKRCQ
jgi:amidophosphoribosyltransferase